RHLAVLDGGAEGDAQVAGQGDVDVAGPVGLLVEVGGVPQRRLEAGQQLGDEPRRLRDVVGVDRAGDLDAGGDAQAGDGGADGAGDRVHQQSDEELRHRATYDSRRASVCQRSTRRFAAVASSRRLTGVVCGAAWTRAGSSLAMASTAATKRSSSAFVADSV